MGKQTVRPGCRIGGACRAPYVLRGYKETRINNGFRIGDTGAVLYIFRVSAVYAPTE
jgi:hypothetical protein